MDRVREIAVGAAVRAGEGFSSDAPPETHRLQVPCLEQTPLRSFPRQPDPSRGEELLPSSLRIQRGFRIARPDIPESSSGFLIAVPLEETIPAALWSQEGVRACFLPEVVGRRPAGRRPDSPPYGSGGEGSTTAANRAKGLVAFADSCGNYGGRGVFDLRPSMTGVCAPVSRPGTRKGASRGS